jgi:hypothetical protein
MTADNRVSQQTQLSGEREAAEYGHNRKGFFQQSFQTRRQVLTLLQAMPTIQPRIRSSDEFEGAPRVSQLVLCSMEIIAHVLNVFCTSGVY